MRDGTIERAGGRVIFRYERVLPHGVDMVWKAIVDPAEMAHWLGASVELEPRVGGTLVTTHRGRQVVTDRVTRFDPPRLFEHTFWCEVNPSALVRWELEATGEGTRLRLTHTLSEADIAAAAATVAHGDDFLAIVSRNGAGWHHILDKLCASLAGGNYERSAGEMAALRARYGVIAS